MDCFNVRRTQILIIRTHSQKLIWIQFECKLPWLNKTMKKNESKFWPSYGKKHQCDFNLVFVVFPLEKLDKNKYLVDSNKLKKMQLILNLDWTFYVYTVFGCVACMHHVHDKREKKIMTCNCTRGKNGQRNKQKVVKLFVQFFFPH